MEVRKSILTTNEIFTWKIKVYNFKALIANIICTAEVLIKMLQVSLYKYL